MDTANGQPLNYYYDLVLPSVQEQKEGKGKNPFDRFAVNNIQFFIK